MSTQPCFSIYPDGSSPGTYVVVRDGKIEAAAQPLHRALSLVETLGEVALNDRLSRYSTCKIGRRWRVYRNLEDVGTFSRQEEAVAFIAASLSREARSLANRVTAYYGEMRLSVLGVLEQVTLHGKVERGAMDRLAAAITTSTPGAALLYDLLEAVENVACPNTADGASVHEALRCLTALDRAALARAERAIDEERRESGDV